MTAILGTILWGSAILLPSIAVYRAFLSPLSRIPGPRLWAMTRLPWAYHLFIGDLVHTTAKLHEKYGPVIRVAPSEVSFTTAEAYKDIFAKPTGKPELSKDPRQFLGPPDGVKGLFWASTDDEHTRIRRNFSHAFSEKGMREQEPIISKYIEQLMLRLRETAGTSQDMCKWYNFTTFDTIGDLALGESFHCLDTASMHSWVAMIFDWIIGAAAMGCLQRFQPLGDILMSLVPQKYKDAENQHRAQSSLWLQKRLANRSPRPDFLTHLIPNIDTQSGLSQAELLECVRVLIVAGSETTATSLSGTTYLLLAHPSALAAITKEIRNAFVAPSEIDMSNLNALRLPYLLAVLTESLRLFPPVPGNMPRLTPASGHVISGMFIPGNITVSPHPYAAFRSPMNFTRADEFCPERWLVPVPEEFAGDNRAVMQPFGVGPRNCLGKGMAYMQMKLVLAKLIWEFDLELDERSELWMDGMKAYGLWQKPELMVRLKESKLRK